MHCDEPAFQTEIYQQQQKRQKIKYTGYTTINFKTLLLRIHYPIMMYFLHRILQIHWAKNKIVCLLLTYLPKIFYWYFFLKIIFIRSIELQCNFASITHKESACCRLIYISTIHYYLINK